MRVLSLAESARLTALRVLWPLASCWSHPEKPGTVYALISLRHRTHGEGADEWLSDRALYMDLETGLTFDRRMAEHPTSFDACFTLLDEG